MYTPDIESQDPLESGEPPSLEPLIPDQGDIIAQPYAEQKAAAIDPLTGMAKLYHAGDPGFADLPKADAGRPNATLALVAAIGGTVALLGVGGYALNRKMQKRKPDVAAASEAEQQLLDVVTGTADVDSASVLPHQFSFDWQR